MIEVKVAEVSISNIGFALFLRPISDEFTKILPIFIGRLELHSIQTAIEKIAPPRPMTHDLMIRMLDALDIKIGKVVITKIHDNTFYADLELIKDGDRITLDARPSDCIALAVRQDAPIFVMEKVYEEAGVEINNEPDQKSEGRSSGEEGEKSGEETTEYKTEEEVLEERLKIALKMENYEEAASIRDQLRSIRNEN